MSRTLLGQSTVLEGDKARNENLPVYRPLYPVRKFGQVLFVYGRADVKSSGLNVEVDQPDTITVIR